MERIQERRGGIMPVQAHGELYHLSAPLNLGNAPMYNQLYIYDPEYTAACRSAHTSNQSLDEEIIADLSDMIANSGICNNNPFVQIYKHEHEILSEEEQHQTSTSNDTYIRLSPRMKMELAAGQDRQTYNLPTANEIAAVIPNEYSDRSFRDILITYRNNSSNSANGLYRRINETHAAYMPLHYVLLFSRGEYGWHWGRRLMSSGNADGNGDDEDGDGIQITR
ncbi:hypothetical protein G6F42_026146 [Rhizopus arrhizus]|nr:hypothetical protein G6F42_026146 [Rhizopus arrhizus]